MRPGLNNQAINRDTMTNTQIFFETANIIVVLITCVAVVVYTVVTVRIYRTMKAQVDATWIALRAQLRPWVRPMWHVNTREGYAEIKLRNNGAAATKVFVSTPDLTDVTEQHIPVLLQNETKMVVLRGVPMENFVRVKIVYGDINGTTYEHVFEMTPSGDVNEVSGKIVE